MKMFLFLKTYLPIWIICFIVTAGYSQTNDAGIWIDPNKSDQNARRSITLNGNNVETFVGNWGNVGQGTVPLSGVWPKGSAHDHIHEFTGLVATQLPDTSGQDVVIISEGYIDGSATRNETDPLTNIDYKYHPVPGYFNNTQGQDEFANSLNPDSWPSSWPGKDASWDGNWNGFFGNNQFNADQEAMYYIDDTWNKEFAIYPFPEDLTDNPDPSNLEQYKNIRGGLGVQIQTRLFQWAHPLAQDVLFFYFEITNVGQYNYQIEDHPVIFGGFGDIGPGGRGTVDDDAFFDSDVDMIYGWDHNNIGVWTVNRDIPPGYLGWKFLESPGIDDDRIDNDDDGLIDEKRDNAAGDLVFGPIGKYGDPVEHFEGDEDGDWNPLIDDVGADGIDKYDEGYEGPDPDGTESNGIPDQGEPNFGKLDNDESDQIGLTSASNPLVGSLFVSDEPAMWEYLQANFFPDFNQNSNQFWVFGSGPVALASQSTERFSTSYVFAFSENQLFRAAGVAQNIFDSDYQFARPPRQPVLKAIPGDGKVTLVWDNLAEFSRDPVYGTDFEGYRIYKSTDPQFLDLEWVTDSFGSKVFRVPLAIYDLNDGLVGPHPMQLGEEIDAGTGIHYDMGNDTGLKHFYVDTDVINGRKYYYAVTAYDKGFYDDFYERGLYDTPNLINITPSECTASIVETNGIITRFDKNTAEVTPGVIPANYSDASVTTGDTLIHLQGFASGNITISVVDETLMDNSEYQVIFKTDTTRPFENITRYYTLFNRTTGDTLLSNLEVPIDYDSDEYLENWTSEALNNGFTLNFENQHPNVEDARAKSGWSPDSKTNIGVTIDKYVAISTLTPISFVVEFDSVIVDTGYGNSRGSVLVPTNYRIYDYNTGEPIEYRVQGFPRDEKIDIGDQIIYVYRESEENTSLETSWALTFTNPVDEDGNELPDSLLVFPQYGDKYYFINNISFKDDDIYSFTTSQRIEKEGQELKNSLENVKVFPNPYIVSSKLEAQPYLSGRGERFITFNNLPDKCKIRIFTVNGDLVRTLEKDDVQGGTLRWDIKTKDNLEVAFGLYIYHISAPGIGEKVGKLAIIN